MKEKFNLRARDYLGTSEGKRQFNREHFAESAGRYDFATKMLSFGQDSRWKRVLVEGLPGKEKPVCLDVACGTGDVTFLLAERYEDGECIGMDLTQEMVDLANQRNRNQSVRFACADMTGLPLEDHSVDILTGSYAIRNAPDLALALAEFQRVVKPGGTLAFLDFSKAASSFGSTFQYLLLQFWGGLWGLLLHGNPEIHSYIGKSLRTFPAPAALEEQFRDAGFAVEKSQSLFGGMMKIYYLRA